MNQLAARSNIRVLYQTEVVAAHGDTSLEAIDVRNAATGETTRLESGGLFILIGADAETAWLPPEIALDQHGYVLTGSDLRDAGQWELERDPYLLETSVPGIFAYGDVRFGPVKRLAAASQSELRVSVQLHHGPPLGRRSWRTRTASKEGRMYP